jgi:hypothetical protein
MKLCRLEKRKNFIADCAGPRILASRATPGKDLPEIPEIARSTCPRPFFGLLRCCMVPTNLRDWSPYLLDRRWGVYYQQLSNIPQETYMKILVIVAIPSLI